MENEAIIEKIKFLTLKEISLTSLCKILELSEYEILGLVRQIKADGVNILTKKHDDDIYLLNLGEKEYNKENHFSFKTDGNNEFKFVAISDTRIGSKSQQLSILTDIYQKAVIWELVLLYIVVILLKVYIVRLMNIMILHF